MLKTERRNISTTLFLFGLKENKNLIPIFGQFTKVGLIPTVQKPY